MNVDGVADADVLALYVIFVVKSGVLDSDAADEDRLQDGVGIEAAGSAHVDADVLENRGGLFGFELVGHRPAWLAGHVAQAVLDGDGVYLGHDAVGFVRQPGPLLFDLPVVGLDLFDGAALPVARVDLEAERLQVLHPLPVGIGNRLPFGVSQRVDEDVQRALRRHAGIELAYGARRRVPGIDEERQPFAGPVIVQLLEAGPGEVDLAPDLEAGRGVLGN